MAYAVEDGLRILWLTRTGSQVSHVSKEVSALPVYGRRMVCIHETVSKIDLRRFNAACRAVKRAGRCPYWPGLPRALKPPLTAKEVRELGRRFEVCPHECLVASLQLARVTAATHMQLSSIGWLLSKWRAKRERTILILDEGQHVVKAALSMVRDSISLRSIEKAAKEAARYGFKELAEKIQGAVESYRSFLPSDGEAEAEDLLPDVDELVFVGEEIQDVKLKEGYVPASHVLSLADFKISLRGAKPILVKEGRSLRLEAPADPVESLKSVYDGWYATITMSATVSGELLESLIGREATLLRAGWPFEEENLTAYIVKGLTTKFEKRDETLINDMAWTVDLAVKRGLKSLIFFPSFELLEKTLSKASKAKEVVAESPGLDQEEVERIITEYVEDSKKTLLSVYNGRLAEGVDLSANLVICLGIPFAPPTVKQQALIKRLSEVLGDEKKARVYGQIIPAVWSAIQAAGRAVRGPNDKATVFLVDDRYRLLLRLLPRWFSERIVRTISLNDLGIALGEVK
jgi:DNA excision repair protein ERCC-2